EREILAARIDGYSPADLDALAAAGEVVWRGVEPVGDRDGRVTLYLTDHLARLWRPPSPSATAGPIDTDALSPRAQAVVEHLRRQGASFFAAVHETAGGGYPGETVDALWDLVWRGLVTNDTFHALRAFTHTHAPTRRGRRRESPAPFRPRRLAPPSAEGRWGLVAGDTRKTGPDTLLALTQQLL